MGVSVFVTGDSHLYLRRFNLKDPRFSPRRLGTYRERVFAGAQPHHVHERDQIIGPGLVDFDFSLEKEGQIAPWGHEGLRLQFRFDLFNAFNRANYSEPNGTLYTSGGACTPSSTNCIDGQNFPQNTLAGTITSTVTSSRQLQFALKLLF